MMALELNKMILACGKNRPEEILLSADEHEEYASGLQGIQKENGINFMGIPVRVKP